MFSTRLTGMPSKRSAVAAGMAEFPTLIRSKHDPAHAASICPRSMPASFSASSNASARSPSVPTSHRSPKREQPIPMIATLSLIPVAIRHPHSIGWRCFPEVAVKASRLVALFDAKTHAQASTHFERLGLHIHELHQQARTQIELRKADIERRRWMVGQHVGGVGQYPSPLLGKTYRSQCAPRGFA